MKNEIVPIFVLEGKPPELKYETIAQRLNKEKGNADNKKNSDTKSKTTSSIHSRRRLKGFINKVSRIEFKK